MVGTRKEEDSDKGRKITMLKVYVANLGKYSEGVLVGEWLDLPATDKEIESLMERIGVGEGSDYGEYAIHGYESDLEEVKIGEFTSLDEINELAERLESVDDEETFETLLNYCGGEISKALDIYDSKNYIFYKDVSDHEELGRYLYDNDLLDAAYYADVICPEHLDYDAIGRDMDYNSSGGFYVNGFLEVY